VTATHQLTDRRAQRRHLRRSTRRRRRGGHGRGPVVLQRTARRVSDLHSTVRQGIARATRGDRPLIVAWLVALGLGVVLVSGPAQSYLDGRERVAALDAKATALDAENDRLSARAAALDDPETIELLAREHQGFIRPGEVPYTLAPPEVDRPQITAPRTQAPAETSPWFQRAWESVRGWLG
jgi:cell division protein FtsB